MKSPVSKMSVSWNYVKDWMSHKFWNPNSDPNLENEESIQGKIVIVTGSNTGIGREAALQLAKRGAKVIMACRDLEKAQVALEYIKSKVPTAQIEILKLDLADLESIRDFVKQFSSKYEKLDILVNNAGFMNTNGTLLKTKDGFEYHMGVNHLGPFLLTRLLIDSLKKGAPSKIVSVASTNISISPLDLDDLMMEKGVRNGDGGLEPYNVSKLANALCIRRLAALLEPNSGIRVFNLCPGFVKTDIFRNESTFGNLFQKLSLRLAGLSPEMGCETIVYCATAKKVQEDKNSGRGEMYRFTNFYEMGTSFLLPDDPDTIRLYKMSEDLVGI